jgi:hypothetical protein
MARDTRPDRRPAVMAGPPTAAVLPHRTTLRALDGHPDARPEIHGKSLASLSTVRQATATTARRI